jgi:plastin-1
MYYISPYITIYHHTIYNTNYTIKHATITTTITNTLDFVHPGDLTALATKAGESHADVLSKLQSLSLTTDKGLVTFESFLKAISQVKTEKKGNYHRVKDSTKIVLHGHGENTTHTINVDEKESFTIHINQVLSTDKHLSTRLPIDPLSMKLFEECKDGLVLAKLVNDSVPGTIDERVLNVNLKLNAFQVTENNNVVVNSCKAIGCSVVNIGASDLFEGREHLVLGLIWQIIKIGLQANIDIKVHPELFRLLNDGEVLEDFLKLPAEQILLRWFNYHLRKAGFAKVIKNFSADVKDGEGYIHLLHQLAPGQCSKAALQTRDLLQRAEQVLVSADKIGCRKYLSPKTLTEGNSKLNFAFVAHLFNTHPGLEKLSDAEMAGLDSSLFDSEGDREARAFALWLNSLGVDPFVNNLFGDLTDGLILLQAIDKVKSETVDWKKVNKPAPIASKFKKVENCNYVTVLGKEMKFSLVGIQGSDIVDGNKKLTLALVWQLMREHVIAVLKSLSKAGHDITDADMISWANQTVKQSGKSSVMSNFKDPSLRNSVFFLDLLNAIKPGIVNYDLLTAASNGKILEFNIFLEDEAKLNAKYAVSIARKLGATIFVLPEDIIEVKPKMVSILFLF